MQFELVSLALLARWVSVLADRCSWGRDPQFGSFDPAGWNISAFWAATTGTARLLCCPMCHCQSGMHLKTFSCMFCSHLWLHFCSGFAVLPLLGGLLEAKVSSERKKILMYTKVPPARFCILLWHLTFYPRSFYDGFFHVWTIPCYVFFSFPWIWHHLYLAAIILWTYREKWK